MVDEVEGDGGVEARHKNKTSPADVVARPVHHDVDGTHVAGFPPEELGEVDHLQHGRHQHAVHHAVHLVRLEGEDADQQGPHCHAEATVGEHLDVKAQHSRVQFRAPVVVEDEVARRPRVAGGGSQ